MKNKKILMISFISKNRNTFFYLVLNICLFIAILLCCIFLKQESIECLYNSINPDIGGTILPIILAIITVIISIEITIRQFFYNRINRRIYSHTSRNVITVLLFFLLSLFFMFKINARYFCCVFMFSVCAVLIELVFVSFDIAKLDSSRTVKPLFRDMTKKMNKRIFPDKELRRFANLLRDCLLNNECINAERVLRYIPRIISEFLKIKHSLDTEECVNKFDKLFSFLQEILMTVKENIENVKGSRVTKITALCLAESIKEAIDYGNTNVIKSIENLIDYYFFDTKFDKEWGIFIFEVSNGTKNIDKKLQWITIFYESRYFINKFASVHIFEMIIYLISKKKIVINFDNFNRFFSLIRKRKNEEEKQYVAQILVLLWQNIPDELLNKFVSNISVKEDFFNIFEVPFDDYYWLLNFVVDECLKNHRGKELSLRKTKINNANYYLYMTKKIGVLDNLELSKDDLTNFYDSFESIYTGLITNGDANDIRFYGGKLISVIPFIKRSENDLIISIIKVLTKIVESVKNSDSKEKVDSVIWLYFKVISKMDGNSSIDENNYETIIDMHFDIVSNLYFSKSLHCATFYRTIFEFDPDDCTFKFINNKSKKAKIEYILSKVYNYVCTSIEDYNDEILTQSSSFIGYSLLFFLSDNNLFYKDIMNKYALAMFDLAISLNYKESMLYYLATLFVVNISFCLNCKKTDARYMFGIETLNKMKIKQLKFVLKAINLRKTDSNYFDKYFGDSVSYINSINQLELQIKKRLKK